MAGKGGPLTALPILQQHGDIASFGFRFGNLAYSCDLSGMPPESAAAQSIGPIQPRTRTLVGGTPRLSAGSEPRPSSAIHPGEVPSGFATISSPTSPAGIPVTCTHSQTYELHVGC